MDLSLYRDDLRRCKPSGATDTGREGGRGPRWARRSPRIDDGFGRHVPVGRLPPWHEPFERVFKFEADGYAPLVTRIVLADEIEARFDVRLRAASTITLTVLLPDGTAAARADIGLISSGARLEIIPGGLGRRGFASGGNLLSADGQGQFRLPPDDAILSVIAAHPGGFTETTTSGLIAEPVIRLQPWVKLEGTYLFDGVPTAGHELLFEYDQGIGKESPQTSRLTV